MAWTRYQLVLALGMVVTGSINTLATKWADEQKEVPGCKNGDRPKEHPFDHPFLQAVGMFIGEFSCLVVFKILWFSKKIRKEPLDDMGNQQFSPFLLFIPAMCDMTGTSLMYVGLTLTYASSFQMLRGAVIVFTALLSVAFLQRVVNGRMWSGIGCVIVGLVLVGLSDFLFESGGDSSYMKNGIITGDLIIIIAQIIAATQMVVEEKFVSGKDINPLQAVGWEGLFGMTTLGLLLIPMYFIIIGSNDDGSVKRLEDSLDGLCQLGNDWKVALGTFGSICSIAFFNFFGISVTKEMSATTRMVLDSIRTVVIWVVSLSVGWEIFHWLQIIGFGILLFGTAVYNNLIPFDRCMSGSGFDYSVNVEPRQEDYDNETDDERVPILAQQKKDENQSEA